MSKKNKAAKASKGNKSKKFFRVFLAIPAVIAVFIAVTSLITAIGMKANLKKAAGFSPVQNEKPRGNGEVRFENVENGVWNIRSDGEIKILQLSDVHLGGGWLSLKKDGMAMNAAAAMISAEKPDFVIVTGDVAYPVPYQSGTLNNKSGAKLFAELMERLGVYWTLCFGNHDTEVYSYYDRDEITEFYSGSYPHCLLQSGPEDADGSGNQIFRIMNSDGIIARSLVTLDSHSYVEGDALGIKWKYDNLHENQIKWYAKAIKAVDAQNAAVLASMTAEKAAKYAAFPKVVPSSAFLHIPLTEYRDAWNEYVGAGYRDTENVKYKYGTVGESGRLVYSGIGEDDFFETALKLGSTDSVFCGHDHLNNFSVNYKGIDLTYTYTVDYLAYVGIYKLGSQRGCTVINVDENGKIDFSSQNYYQDKYVSRFKKESVTMQELGAGGD